MFHASKTNLQEPAATDEARCVVSAMDFIEISVNEIVWTMENEGWFDKEEM